MFLESANTRLLEYGIRLDPAPDPAWQFWKAGSAETYWTQENTERVLATVDSLVEALGGVSKFRARWTGGVIMCCRQIPFGGTADKGLVTLSAAGFDDWTVVHELSHAWDAAHGWQLSRAMQEAMGAGFPTTAARIRHELRYLHLLPPAPPSEWYQPGKYPPPCGINANFNEREDFAETVTAWVYPDRAKNTAAARGWPYRDYATFADTPRGLWLADLLRGVFSQF
jgi:hypothetical protein